MSKTREERRGKRSMRVTVTGYRKRTNRKRRWRRYILISYLYTKKADGEKC